jgi:methyl-accepting chemotaxis protein
MSMWTFGRRLGAGFGLTFVLLALVGLVAYRSVEALTTTSYRVSRSHAISERIAVLLGQVKDAETGQRGFLLTGDPAFLEPFTSGAAAVPGALRELRRLTADDPAQQRRLDRLEPLIAQKLAELQRTIALRKSAGLEASVKAVAEGTGKRIMDDVRRLLQEMDNEEHDLLRTRADEVEAAASAARLTIGLGTLASLLLSVGVAVLLSRTLAVQVGSAVRHVESSSAELQAAANQQVTSAKEQAAAMTEITTTITELLATSRQIADSAQRVARIAGDTAAAAGRGDDTVSRTQDSIAGIKRHVDAIVTNMVDLGRRSQQIGAILDIINELAEQTNILAINATIEAVGAGDSGRRFGVVADEIRKLADRVAGSTKEIRGLVEDVRASVNATVMATEAGSKAADGGSRQFGEVAASFSQIAGLVGTTSEVAREIELSTKQQATAVEQVNLAIASVSQAARESEASSAQTLQTSSELSAVSKGLVRLIQAAPAG